MSSHGERLLQMPMIPLTAHEKARATSAILAAVERKAITTHEAKEILQALGLAEKKE